MHIGLLLYKIKIIKFFSITVLFLVDCFAAVPNIFIYQTVNLFTLKLGLQ